MLVFLFFSIYTPFSCLLILRAFWFVFSLSSSPAPPPFVWIQARTTNPLALKMLGTVLLPALLNKWSSLSLLFFLVFLFLMMLVLFILYISLNKGASLSTQSAAHLLTYSVQLPLLKDHLLSITPNSLKSLPLAFQFCHMY